jgi:hypothetical protein
MDKVQKNNFTDYNAPSSEPFRLQKIIFTKLNTLVRKPLLEDLDGKITLRWILGIQV